MIDKRINHTFWCFNENSGDTGGLVYDDFGKWDEVKYEFVKPSLWQTESGKFISLDHQRALGQEGNGISLSDFYASGQGSNIDGGKKGSDQPKETTSTTKVTTTSTTTKKTTTSTTTTKVTTPDVSDKDIVYGDANCDGTVDMADVVLIMQSLANPNKYGINGTAEKCMTVKGQKNADIPGTSKGVTTEDALAIQQYLLGKRSIDGKA